MFFIPVTTLKGSDDGGNDWDTPLKPIKKVEVEQNGSRGGVRRGREHGLGGEWKRLNGVEAWAWGYLGLSKHKETQEAPRLSVTNG